MTSNLINEIANYLKVYLEIDLDQTYCRTKYDFPNLSLVQRENLEKQEPFERQILLKDYVSAILCGSFENWDMDAWIVHEWGGIRNFDITKHQRIIEFRNALTEGLPIPFTGISSLSKIASFVRPTDCFVYDSRVTFALNGILLDLLGKVDNIRFFPIPSAQGGRHIAMNQIIAQRVDNPAFYPKQQAYSIYNQLIIKLDKILFPGTDKSQPCRVEMLLFELGKTDGVIARKVGIGPKRETTKAKQSNKRPTSVVNGTSVLKEGTVILGRTVHSGFKIIREGTIIYLFVGKDKKKTFCEVLSKNGQYKLDSKLIENGFERKGGSNPYYIKRFDIDDIAMAVSFMDIIKEFFQSY